LKRITALLAAGLLSTLAIAGHAAEAPATDKDGWRELFNGKDLTGWKGKEGGWKIEDGVLVGGKGAGDLWTKERFGDFILDLEFKIDKGANSGVFIRTDKIEEWLHTGIEIQVFDSFGKTKLDKHDCGAVYDVQEPSKNMVKAPGEWNHYTITAKANKIQVALNGEQVVDMDLDRWIEARKNPDGTPNKFRTAYKDMKREGFIGLQEHGSKVWYRNIKIKVLAPNDAAKP
jgi:Domain of Unknown Function (DUF1080)